MTFFQNCQDPVIKFILNFVVNTTSISLLPYNTIQKNEIY